MFDRLRSNHLAHIGIVFLISISCFWFEKKNGGSTFKPGLIQLIAPIQHMSSYLGETFEGVVSGVASFGFWVETIAHKCEGLVSLLSLMDFDEFRYMEEDYCLIGKRSGKTIRMGDKVEICVVAANLDKRQLDYELVVAGGAPNKKRKKQP